MTADYRLSDDGRPGPLAGNVPLGGWRRGMHAEIASRGLDAVAQPETERRLADFHDRTDPWCRCDNCLEQRGLGPAPGYLPSLPPEKPQLPGSDPPKRSRDDMMLGWRAVEILNHRQR